ncbi:MAG TPA: TonB-dependent receptor [Kofleriaceae bacterium]|nr:TonB-dependent receptor [Kofleriaceae bacterium]
MKRIGYSLAMAVGLLTAASTITLEPATAQTSQTGAVRGRVVDKASKEAVIGATVVATGPALQGQQAEISDENGAFTIANLPPGVYVLTVYYNEAQFSRPNVVIELGKQSFVNIPIDTSVQTSEIIELEGRAPIVDQGSTKTGTTITDEYTTRIPTGRTFGAVLGTAAGTQGDQYGVSFSGATSAENTYIVEGINTTDTAFGLQSSNLPNEFIEETEVIAGGYAAEFGRSTGGVINVVTKQGSNQFKGSIFGYYTPGSLVAQADPILREGTAIGSETNLDYRADVGFEVGGPIKKDKIWFHVGYNPSFSKDVVDRITSRNVDVNQDGDPDVDDATGFLVAEEVARNSLSRTLQTHFFTAKINAALSQNHQFQISGFGNPRSIDRDFYRLIGDRNAQLYKFDDGAYDAALKWTSKFNDNKTQVDAVLGYHVGYEHQVPYFAGGEDAQVIQYRYTRPLSDFAGFENHLYANGCTDNDAGDLYPMISNCPVVGYSINGLGFLEERENARMSANLALTQRVKALGHHTFKLGADLELTTYDSHRGYTGDIIWQQTTPWNGDTMRGGTWNERSLLVVNPDGDIPCVGGNAMCSVADGGIDANTANRNLAFYLQDSWQVRPNLTINAGLRWERQTALVADSLKGTISPDGEVIPDVAFELDNMIAPRIGAIYDPTQEGRSKLFAHWGRFYESVPMDINVRAFGGELLNINVIRTFDALGRPTCPEAGPTFDPAVLNACARGTIGAAQLGGGTEFVAPSLRGQYINEIILGAEYELMADFKMGINYVRRNMPIAIEDVSTDGGTNYLIANPGEDFSDDAADLRAQADALMNDADPSNDSLAELYESRASQLDSVKNFDKPVRDYQALQITATQRFSKDTMLLASYTYSRSKGNFPGLFSTETGQLDPNLTSMYDLPDLMGNRYGSLGLDRPHLFKLDGFRQLDMKKAGVLILGFSFRGQSGIAHNSLASHPVYGADESYLLPRGNNNRSPFVWNVDLKATYGYKVSKTQTLEAFIDLFNVLNDQSETDADERYTLDNANPIIGGDPEDLKHSKTLDGDGLEQNATPEVNKNYGQLNARQAPLSVRLGLRYTF